MGELRSSTWENSKRKRQLYMMAKTYVKIEEVGTVDFDICISKSILRSGALLV